MTIARISEKVQIIRTAMGKGWKEVVELYERDPEAHTTKISKTGYTALHVAVAEGKEDVVEKLLRSIKERLNVIRKRKLMREMELEESVSEIENQSVKSVEEEQEKYKPLQIRNQLGNTPLHLAAFMGNVEMCKIMISTEIDVGHLLKIENEDGETPIFMAALHGKKKVFLYLNSVLQEKIPNPEEAIRTCRRDNGDAILHSAITGEFFGKYSKEETKNKKF